MSSEVTRLLEAPADLGAPREEYLALVEACAVTVRADRGAVRVSGERRGEMLNGLLTNRVTGSSRSGCHAMLLTPKGRVLSDLRVLPRSDDIVLDVPGAGLENVLQAFAKYLPPLYARFEDAGDRLRWLALYGPLAPTAALAALGEPAPEGDLEVREVIVDGTSVLMIRSRRVTGDGVEFLVPKESAAKLAERLLVGVGDVGGRPAGRKAVEIVRVEAGVPRYGMDIDESNLAQETGLEAESISHDKGCYLGQEVVARIHFRGHVNRHLCGLEFSGEVVRPGALLFDGDKQVGSVTSSVDSPRFGPIGLGYVRREVERSSRVRWVHEAREGPATVVDLPFRGV
jgi:folate-binding protein YgfZ